ncbi:hypothetical protein V8F06_008269 [Rhypophila decipiens]
MAGGVCAVLDYEVELMAQYVTELTMRLVKPQSTMDICNRDFLKFVSQILSSTRLPTTTILLGMNYLSRRVYTLNASDRNGLSDGKIWRMLTVALLLGSKFLDDNTFQNKSWSDVSGIQVKELNAMEYEWLSAMNWELYVNLDESNEYKAWLSDWEQWQSNKKRKQAQASRERLAALVTPIETDLARPRNPYLQTWHQQQIAEFERYERLSSMKNNQAPQHAAYRREQATWNYPVAWPQSAPLTPPDSGYGTPEYVNSATSANNHYTEWFDRAIDCNGTAPRHYQQQPPVYNAFNGGHASRTPSHYPSYYNGNYHNIWDHPSVADCNCASCVSPHTTQRPYFAGHAYGQPVVG